jgi:hypothetical protein
MFPFSETREKISRGIGKTGINIVTWTKQEQETLILGVEGLGRHLREPGQENVRENGKDLSITQSFL